MSNAIHLDFNWRTKDDAKAEVRANAVFIHTKLVAGGMSDADAATAVENLFSSGYSEGYEDGYDAADQSSSNEFDK